MAVGKLFGGFQTPIESSPFLPGQSVSTGHILSPTPDDVADKRRLKTDEFLVIAHFLNHSPGNYHTQSPQLAPLS